VVAADAKVFLPVAQLLPQLGGDPSFGFRSDPGGAGLSKEAGGRPGCRYPLEALTAGFCSPLSHTTDGSLKVESKLATFARRAAAR
jgi:hypothetical protein